MITHLQLKCIIMEEYNGQIIKQYDIDNINAMFNMSKLYTAMKTSIKDALIAIYNFMSASFSTLVSFYYKIIHRYSTKNTSALVNDIINYIRIDVSNSNKQQLYMEAEDTEALKTYESINKILQTDYMKTVTFSEEELHRDLVGERGVRIIKQKMLINKFGYDILATQDTLKQMVNDLNNIDKYHNMLTNNLKTSGYDPLLPIQFTEKIHNSDVKGLEQGVVNMYKNIQKLDEKIKSEQIDKLSPGANTDMKKMMKRYTYNMKKHIKFIHAMRIKYAEYHKKHALFINVATVFLSLAGIIIGYLIYNKYSLDELVGINNDVHALLTEGILSKAYNMWELIVNVYHKIKEYFMYIISTISGKLAIVLFMFSVFIYLQMKYAERDFKQEM